jgi:hypothetical protein
LSAQADFALSGGDGRPLERVRSHAPAAPTSSGKQILLQGVDEWGKSVKRTILIEALVFWCIGILAMIEALRLLVFKDPHVLYDVLGPGYFVLLISIAILMTGTFYFLGNYKKCNGKEAAQPDAEAMIPVFHTVLAVTGYIFLIGIVGYVLATFVFFVVQLWVFGVRSWKINVGSAVILAAIYYYLFVELCSLIFPRSHLSPLFDMFLQS